MSSNINESYVFHSDTAYSNLESVFKIIKEGIVPVITRKKYEDFTFWTNFSSPSLRPEEQRNFLFPDSLPDDLYERLIEEKVGIEPFRQLTEEQKLAMRPTVYEEYKAKAITDKQDLTAKFKNDKNQVFISLSQVFDNNVNQPWNKLKNIPDSKKVFLRDTFFDLMSLQSWYKYTVDVSFTLSDEVFASNLATNIMNNIQIDKFLYVTDMPPLRFKLEPSFLAIPKLLYNLNDETKLREKLRYISKGNITLRHDLGTGEANAMFMGFKTVPLIKFSGIDQPMGEKKVKVSFELEMSLPYKLVFQLNMSANDMKGIAFTEKSISLSSVQDKINSSLKYFLIQGISNDKKLREVAICAGKYYEEYYHLLARLANKQYDLHEDEEIFIELRTELIAKLEAMTTNDQLMAFYVAFESAVASKEINVNQEFKEDQVMQGVVNFELEYLKKFITEIGITQDDLDAVANNQKYFFINTETLTAKEREVVAPLLTSNPTIKNISISLKDEIVEDEFVLDELFQNKPYEAAWTKIRTILFENSAKELIERLEIKDLRIATLLGKGGITDGTLKIDVTRADGSEYTNFSIKQDGTRFFIEFEEALEDRFFQAVFLEKEVTSG